MNTPFKDVVVIVADMKEEMGRKIQYYMTQRYVVAIQPTVFEDVTFDMEAVNRPIVQLPSNGLGVTIMTRQD
jgi:hypothetical protein